VHNNTVKVMMPMLAHPEYQTAAAAAVLTSLLLLHLAAPLLAAPGEQPLHKVLQPDAHTWRQEDTGDSNRSVGCV
jgi:hypothetical protein